MEEFLDNGARLARATALMHIRVEAMQAHELDLGCALLLGYDIRVDAQHVAVRTGQAGWRPWSVVHDWGDYGELVSTTAVVVGTHERYDDPDDTEKVTGYWFSCHARFGATSCEGDDLRTVVARSAVKLLEHRIRFCCA